MISITAELQYFNNGAWTSFNPAAIQNATINGNNWSTLGWVNLQGGSATGLSPC